MTMSREALTCNRHKRFHKMTRTYSLVVEGNPSCGYSAYVPELPTILVTADSYAQLTARAKEAIQI